MIDRQRINPIGYKQFDAFVLSTRPWFVADCRDKFVVSGNIIISVISVQSGHKDILSVVFKKRAP